MYPTRLRWDSHSGCGIARHDGVSVELHRGPGLPGLDGMTELDFVPHVIAAVRVGSESVREMSADEIRMALKLLEQVATDARDAVDGQSSIVVVQRFSGGR